VGEGGLEELAPLEHLSVFGVGVDGFGQLDQFAFMGDGSVSEASGGQATLDAEISYQAGLAQVLLLTEGRELSSSRLVRVCQYLLVSRLLVDVVEEVSELAPQLVQLLVSLHTLSFGLFQSRAPAQGRLLAFIRQLFEFLVLAGLFLDGLPLFGSISK
jgi:hypothetical protein